LLNLPDLVFSLDDQILLEVDLVLLRQSWFIELLELLLTVAASGRW